MKILIAEDEADIRYLLTVYFEGKGHQVVTSEDGGKALQMVWSEKPDLLLLDIRMPVLDGFAVLEAVRTFNAQLPIIMITALDSADDAAKGLRLGADDYLRKPFSLLELDARISTVMRRLEHQAAQVIRLGPLRIDDRGKEVKLQGERIDLSPKEYSLLRLLASEPGRAFSSDEIIHYLWEDLERADKGNVKQYIHLLRKKISVDGLSLDTVTGFGYKLEATPNHTPHESPTP